MRAIIRAIGAITLTSAVSLSVATTASAEPLRGWFDNTDSFKINRSAPIQSRRSPNAQMRFNLHNISGGRIERPYRLAFEGLPQGISVEGAHTQEDGTQYLDLEYIIGDGLDSKEVHPNFTVTFLNVGRTRFSFTPAIYSPEPLPFNGCQKERWVDGDKYCFQLNRTDVGQFVNATVARWNPDTQSYNSPKLVLTAEDLWDKGDRDNDFTQALIRSVKWFTCPGTGKSSMYAKRQWMLDDGTTIFTKDLLRATVTNPQGNVDSPWTDSLIVGRPYGYTSGDLGDFGEGATKYIVTAEEDEIMIMELEPDCSDVLATADGEPLLKRPWFKEDGSIDKREAPAVFKREGYWFLHTSGKTGWRPNQHKYAYATDLAGPWSDMIEIGDFTGYHSQAFFIAQNKGTDVTTKIFPGTRNGAIVPGDLGHGNIRLPIYFNQTTLMTTNYYDYSIENPDGTVIGKHNDHGQKLSVVDYSVTNHPNIKPYGLLDNDKNTEWVTDNPNVKQITFDLGETRLVKALKVRNYDFNGIFNNFMSDYKIEIGDGVSSWTTVWDKWILLMNWLQPLDITDTQGRFVRMTHKATYRTNESQLDYRNNWGFYQVELWGDDAWDQYSLSDDFEDGNLAGWIVERTSTWSSVQITDDSVGKVVRISDDDPAKRAKILHRFEPQTGNDLKLSMKMKFEVLGAGEVIRLLNGTDKAVELVNSTDTGNLALIRGNGELVPIASLIGGEWYDLAININLDLGTYDVFLNGAVIWGGEWLINQVSEINGFTVTTSNAITGSDSSYDDIRFKGPLTPGNYVVPPPPEPAVAPFFTDDFENGYDKTLWTAQNWRTQEVGLNGTRAARAPDPNGGFYLTYRGDEQWTNYSFSADVQSRAIASGIRGRVNNNNKSFYELKIERDTSRLLLRKKFKDGTPFVMRSKTLQNLSQDVYYNLKLVFQNNIITVYLDGVEQWQVTDNLPLGSGRIALFKQGGAPVLFDNVVVEAIQP